MYRKDTCSARTMANGIHLQPSYCKGHCPVGREWRNNVPPDSSHRLTVLLPTYSYTSTLTSDTSFFLIILQNCPSNACRLVYVSTFSTQHAHLLNTLCIRELNMILTVKSNFFLTHPSLAGCYVWGSTLCPLWDTNWVIIYYVN
jgi:hypothetical protein